MLILYLCGLSWKVIQISVNYFVFDLGSNIDAIMLRKGVKRALNLCLSDQLMTWYAISKSEIIEISPFGQEASAASDINIDKVSAGDDDCVSFLMRGTYRRDRSPFHGIMTPMGRFPSIQLFVNQYKPSLMAITYNRFFFKSHYHKVRKMKLSYVENCLDHTEVGDFLTDDAINSLINDQQILIREKASRLNIFKNPADHRILMKDEVEMRKMCENSPYSLDQIATIDESWIYHKPVYVGHERQWTCSHEPTFKQPKFNTLKYKRRMFIISFNWKGEFLVDYLL